MPPFPFTIRKVPTAFVLILLFLLLLAFRIHINHDTLGVDYMDDIFRVGVVPWSDAKAWVDGAIQVVNGESISGVSSARPLYPLFLSLLFFIGGVSYSGAIYAQMMFSALVVTAACFLLKPLPGRIGVWVFISFLSIWRPEVSTMFLTENLGMYSLILSFALIWRGAAADCRWATLSGFFLLGLSQAVRPWCVLTLATVPFFCFFSSTPLKKKIKSFTVHVLFISLGFSFHPAASALFNRPGEGYANNPQTLYGQVVGGKGWTAVYDDPNIAKALKENQSSDAVNRIIYRRIREEFFKNPVNFIEAAAKGYVHYFRTIGKEFGLPRTSPIYFAIFFLLIAFLDQPSIVKRSIAVFKSRPLILAGWFLGIGLFLFLYEWFWMLVTVSGVLIGAAHPKQRLHAVILLYLAGVIMTIPLVGRDGGMRVMIGNDILLYLLCGVGACGLTRQSCIFASNQSASHVGYSPDRLRPAHALGIVYGTLILLLVIPLSIRLLRQPGAEEMLMPRLTTRDVAVLSDIEETPVSSDDLVALWHEWPEKSLEKLDGKPAFTLIRYIPDDTVFLDADKGFTEMRASVSYHHWPLSPMNIPRTVMIRQSWYTIFPYTTPDRLHQFANRKVILVGNLLTRRRPFRYATPLVLIVSHIISLDDSGRLSVLRLISSPLKINIT
jgi:hypothetical protein